MANTPNGNQNANPNPNPTLPNRALRQIRGPQSALTDFLASHNISANQIRQDANARRAAALASQQAEAPAEFNSAAEEEESDPEPAPVRKRETKAQSAKRKREEKAIAKIKASKKFQRRRQQNGTDSDEDDIALNMYDESMAPLPAQMENCEICEKRFTVTGYSKTGPDGGLLCPKCTKELNKEEGLAKRRKKSAAGQARRKMQSNLLDGIYPGAKSLVTLSIETLARNVDMADSLGDLPASLVDKLSAILCKRRLMSSVTLDLFLQPGTDSITIYDAAKLSSDDFIRIFQIVPTLKQLRLRNAIQFKNKVMDHLLGTTVNLESLSLHGSNLIDDERWNRYLKEKGMNLKALKVYWTDGHFGDEQVEILATTCPNLNRLKVCHNQKVTDAGLANIANISTLEHLSLEIYNLQNPTTSVPYVQILNSIGSTLRTLSLSTVHIIDDTVLSAIHSNCQKLSKLRITDNEVLTDSGFTKLFTNWYNPALHYIDLHKCRQIDSADLTNPTSIGLCSSGFIALMSHSIKNLKYLNVNSCRHISKEAFETVFSLDKTYLELREIDVSFCQEVDDFVVGCIFKCCPNLKTCKVFGCFGVGKVRVPKGKILIGVPNALGMQIEGVDDEVEEVGRII